MKFNDQTVSIVIGGTSGIGKGVSEALSTRPGTVHVASRSTGLNIQNEQSLAEYFESIGTIDHLIVTAGSAAPSGAINDVAINEAKSAFDIKLWGSIAAAKFAAPHIRAGGSITLTSGFLARRTVPGTFVKTAMNAAIEATAKVMAKEFAPIRINVISPGLTDTNAYAGMDEKARQSMLRNAAENLPAGKVGSVSDLAKGYLFVIDNPFTTGAVIDIDGGALVS